MTETAFRKLCKEMKRQAGQLGEITDEVRALWPDCDTPGCTFRAAVHLYSRYCFPCTIHYCGGIRDTVSGPFQVVAFAPSMIFCPN